MRLVFLSVSFFLFAILTQGYSASHYFEKQLAPFNIPETSGSYARSKSISAREERSMVTLTDSLALVALYQSTDGDHWIRNDQWLTGTVDTWYGVTVNNTSGRVSHLVLNDNNLHGSIPEELGDLQAIETIDLYGNQLSGEVPESVTHLTNLIQLYLANNQLTGLPAFYGAQSNGDFYFEIKIDGNRLTFEDLLPNKAWLDIPLTMYTTYTQKPLGDTTYLTNLKEGQTFTISLGVDQEVEGNQYIWLRDSVAIYTSDTNSFTIPAVTVEDTGTYTCLVTNDNLSLHEVYFEEYLLQVEKDTNRTISFQDSLALVAVYEATNGENWTHNDNWLTGQANSWYGIRINDTLSVSGISLENNNLAGTLPQEINRLQALSSVNLSGNHIFALPYGFLKNTNAAGWIRDNDLTIEDFLDQPFRLKYDQQNKVGVDTTVNLVEGANYTIALGIDEDVVDNQYIWFKDNQPVDTTSENRWTIANIRMEDAGTYTCQVTNPRVSLVLYSHPVMLKVSPEAQASFIQVSDACLGYSVSFYAQGRHHLDTYFWEVISTADSTQRIVLPDSAVTSRDFSYTVPMAGQFTAQVTLRNPYLEDTVLRQNFNVYGLPNITLPESIYLQNGQATLKAVAEEKTGYTYEWNGGDSLKLENSNTITVFNPGTYRVKVNNQYGCFSSAEIIVSEDTTRQEQVITWNALPAITYGDAPFVLQAGASSGLPIDFSVVQGGNNISIDHHTVTILQAGEVMIKAVQAGNETYRSVEDALSFIINKVSQEITMNTLPDVTLGENTIALEAQASSGLEVSYRVSGPVILEQGYLYLQDTGTVTVIASQSGNGNFLPAEDYVQSFRVSEIEMPAVQEDSVFQMTILVNTPEGMDLSGARLRLYRLNENHQFILVKERGMSSNSVVFDSLESGQYTLSLHPAGSSFLPVYHGNKLTLADAETIDLDHDIVSQVSPIRAPELLSKGNKVISGLLMKDPDNSQGKFLLNKLQQEGVPYTDVAVYLLASETEEVVGFTVTDEKGAFSFTELASGTYLFVADCEGISNDREQNLITVEANTATVTMTAIVGTSVRVAEVQTESVVTSLETPVQSPKIGYYPNPVLTDITIQLDHLWLGGQITVFTAFGQQIIEQVITKEEMNINLQDQAAGLYTITLQKGKYQYSLKVLKK